MQVIETLFSDKKFVDSYLSMIPIWVDIKNQNPELNIEIKFDSGLHPVNEFARLMKAKEKIQFIAEKNCIIMSEDLALYAVCFEHFRQKNGSNMEIFHSMWDDIPS